MYVYSESLNTKEKINVFDRTHIQNKYLYQIVLSIHNLTNLYYVITLLLVHYLLK